MASSRILIVDSNARRVQQVQDALSAALLSQPVIQTDGESAVLWASVHECDLCILSYELPGIDGLETLARIRARQPELPVIMVAESTDQDVAIAAFRAGVFDFVPATGAFARAVADKARQYLDPERVSREAPNQAATDPALRNVPAQRLASTYQNRLRTIGRQLDIYQYHSPCIVEADGGFLVRAMKQRSRRPQALEFSDRELSQMVISAIRSEGEDQEKTVYASDLIPTGYEDMLRALGFRLDKISAETIVVVELDDMVVASGRGNDETSAAPGLVPFKMFLRQPDIEYMLNEAFYRRGTGQPQVRQSTGQTGGLRRILRRLN